MVREQSNPNQDPVADKYSGYWAFGADADITVQTGQPFKYTGQPFDNEGGLGLYYYGARYYDPVLGRFMAVDPLAGKYPSLSPYVYCANNPLKHKDSDGRFIDTILDVASIVLSTIDLIKNPSWKNAGYLGADVACAAIPFLPSAGSVRHATKLGKFFNKASDAGGAANKIDNATDLRKAPPANDGVAKPHGGKQHQQAIADEVSMLQGQGAENIRVNQQQVDVNGNIIGTNRPDVQGDLEGVHRVIEIDHSPSRSQAHMDTIENHDPQANATKIILKKE